MAQTETRQEYEFDFSGVTLEDLPPHADDTWARTLHVPIPLEDPLDKMRTKVKYFTEDTPYRQVGERTLIAPESPINSDEPVFHAEGDIFGEVPSDKMSELLGAGIDHLTKDIEDTGFGHRKGRVYDAHGFVMDVGTAGGRITTETYPRHVADFEPVVTRYGEAMEGLVNGIYEKAAPEDT